MDDVSSSSTHQSPADSLLPSSPKSMPLFNADIPLAVPLDSTQTKKATGMESLDSTKETSQLLVTQSEKLSLEDVQKQTEQRYEFTFVCNGQLSCAVLWDNDLVSACERVLCHPVDSDRIIKSRSGNYFLVADDGTHWAVRIHNCPVTAVFINPSVDPSELTTKKTKTLNENDILQGLI